MDNITLMAFGLLAQQLISPQDAMKDSPFADAISNLSCSSSPDASLTACGNLISIKPSVLRENDTFVNTSGRGYYFSEVNLTVPQAILSGNWCNVQVTMEAFYQSYQFSLGGSQVYSSSTTNAYSQPVLPGQALQLLNGSAGWINFSYSSAAGRQAFLSNFTAIASLEADYYALKSHFSWTAGYLRVWSTCDLEQREYYSYSANLAQSEPVTVESPALNFSILLDRDYNSSCRVVIGFSDGFNASNWQMNYAGFGAWNEGSAYSVYPDGHGARQIYWSQKEHPLFGGNDSFALSGHDYWAASFIRQGSCSSLPRIGLLSVENEFENYSENVTVTQLRQSELNYSVAPENPEFGDNVTVVFSVNNFRPINLLVGNASSVVVPNSSDQARISFELNDAQSSVKASQGFDSDWSSVELVVPLASHDIVGRMWELGWLAIGIAPIFQGMNRIARTSNSLPAVSFKMGVALLALYALLTVM